MEKLPWESKLEWEDKGPYLIAWLPDKPRKVDASSLEVSTVEEPGKGYRWCVWFEDGYAPSVDEAKVAVERAAAKTLLGVLVEMGVIVR